MDILSLFVVVPVITILALVFAKGLKQARLSFNGWKYGSTWNGYQLSICLF